MPPWEGLSDETVVGHRSDPRPAGPVRGHRRAVSGRSGAGRSRRRGAGRETGHLLPGREALRRRDRHPVRSLLRPLRPARPPRPLPGLRPARPAHPTRPARPPEYAGRRQGEGPHLLPCAHSRERPGRAGGPHRPHCHPGAGGRFARRDHPEPGRHQGNGGLRTPTVTPAAGMDRPAEQRPAGYTDRVRAFLGKPHVAVLATVGPGGRLQATPVWFLVEDGQILINTSRGRAKLRNMEANPRVALTIVDQNDPYAYVEIQGRAVRFEPQRGARAIDRLSLRYRGKPFTYPPTDRPANRVSVFIVPDRIIDHLR